MGTNFCYSFDVKGVKNSEANHKLYRKDMRDSSAIDLMGPSNPDPSTVGPPPLPALMHANDAALVSYTGGSEDYRFIYVAAWSDVVANNSLVMLRYFPSGNRSGQYYEWRRYIYPYSSTGMKVGGVARTSGGDASTTINLLIKEQKTFHRVSIAWDRSNGTLPLGTNFSIDYKDKAGNDFNCYTPQSFHYEDVNGGTIYVPMFAWDSKHPDNRHVEKKNENVVLVYRGIKTTTEKNIEADESYIIKSGLTKM